MDRKVKMNVRGKKAKFKELFYFFIYIFFKIGVFYLYSDEKE